MIRVFPRKTKWTPTDELAFVGDPPLPAFRPTDRTTPVFVSCAFTWDLPRARRLQQSWARFYDKALLGGPACDDPGGEFMSGRFIKEGVTITSRGCPRQCPWCYVSRREGDIRELPIKPGWIIQDNNLLACSKSHLEAVFLMLSRQRHGAVFSGGLDARLFTVWHLELLDRIRFSELWFAADSPRSMAAIERVARLCGDIPRGKLRCYVMIGYRESLTEAEARLERIYKLGFLPFAQLYVGERVCEGRLAYSTEWRQLARKWSRPAAYRRRTTEAA